MVERVDVQATFCYTCDMAEVQEKVVADELKRLGSRLRLMRTLCGWTLDEAARQAALSKSYLSRLEEGERQPSLAALLALSRAFQVPLSSLFGEEAGARSGIVTRAGEVSFQQGNGLRYTSLSGSVRVRNMQPLRVTVPADRTGDELYRHDGEEWLYVLSGTLKLTLSAETFLLHSGDAAHFDAREPHRLSALHGTDAELILVACAEPRPLLDSYF